MELTKDALLEYLTDRMGLARDVLQDDVALFSSGLLDSFSLLDMIMFIEKQASVKMSPAEVNLENLDSIGKIMSFVAAKTQ